MDFAHPGRDSADLSENAVGRSFDRSTEGDQGEVVRTCDTTSEESTCSAKSRRGIVAEEEKVGRFY